MRLWLAALFAVACSESNESGADAGISEDAAVRPVWYRELGVPTTETLLGVWGTSANEVYAVGWNGTILRYDGRTWRTEVTTATVPLTAIHGLVPDPMVPDAPATVFAVGWRGTILERSQDGWRPAAYTSSAGEDLAGVHVIDPESALAVGDGGRMHHWDGTAWSVLPWSVPSVLMDRRIEPKSALKDVWSPRGNRYYFVGTSGTAYRSENRTADFEALDTRIPDPLSAVWGNANDRVYAVGLGSLILRFDGQWRRIQGDDIDLLPNTFWMDVTGVDDDVTVVGWRGKVARFENGSWLEEATGIDTDLRAVWIDPTTRLAFAVGANGTIIRRDPPPPPDAGM